MCRGHSEGLEKWLWSSFGYRWRLSIWGYRIIEFMWMVICVSRPEYRWWWKRFVEYDFEDLMREISFKNTILWKQLPGVTWNFRVYIRTSTNHPSTSYRQLSQVKIDTCARNPRNWSKKAVPKLFLINILKWGLTDYFIIRVFLTEEHN